MRKEKITKKNIYDWYEDDKFKNAIQYANKCSNIEGVNQYLSQLQSNFQNYNKEINALVENESPILDNSFFMCYKVEKVINICKWVSIVSFILFIMGIASGTRSIIPLLVANIAILGCIAAVILKISGVVLKAKYNSNLKSVEEKVRIINQKHLNGIPLLWNKIDNLYLASLEPTHREAVLMRRDQERQHQEKIQVEMQHQRVVEEEQRKTRKTQEEILQIEREREKRYWKNRY